MLAFSQHNNIKGCVNMPEVAVRQQIEQHNAYKVEKAFEHYSYFVSSYYGFPWTQVKSHDQLFRKKQQETPAQKKKPPVPQSKRNARVSLRPYTIERWRTDSSAPDLFY